MDPLLVDLARYGVALVGFNVLLQQLGLPIPAVPTMMLAGALAVDGRISGSGVFAISVAATMLADTLWFWGGQRFGYPVLRLLCRVSMSPDGCVRQTEGIFARYGFYSLIVSKFVPGFSTVAPPVAGALRMPLARFLVATVASAALWVGAAMGAGALFASQIESLLGLIARHAGAAAMVALALFAAYLAWRGVRRWRLSRYIEGSLISVEELATLLESDVPPLVVDVGSPLAHAARPRVRGALLMDLDAIRDHAFPLGRAIVTYCACPNEASAKRAAQILIARGYVDVRPLGGGLDRWVAGGFPIDPAPPVARMDATLATPLRPG